MTQDGITYKLTNHARERFLERVGQVTPSEMLRMAVAGIPGVKCVWEEDEIDRDRMHLITVYRKEEALV
jgi:hypothetical protein